MVVCLLVVMTTGCDRKSRRDRGDDDISVSPTGPSQVLHLMIAPQNVVHLVGVKQCFVATGGSGNYRWMLDNGTGPTLLSADGDRACYQPFFPVKYTMTVTSGNQSVTARGEAFQ